MKVKGESVKARAEGEVVIPRANGEDLRFRVRAFPLGLEEVYEEKFPSPTAPWRFVTGRRGKILRDPKTNQVEKVRDEDDPEYKRARSLSNRRQMCGLVVEGLKADPDVQWETDPALFETDPAAYMDGIWEEFKAAGLSSGDLGIIIDKVRELGNLGGKEIDEAVDDFLSPEQGA